MSLGRLCIVISVLACCLSTVSPAGAKGVTLNRILDDHLMHVVTTESSASVSKFMVDLRLKDPSLMTMADLLPKSAKLRKEEGILFVIDRSKAKSLTAEEERLLPYPSAAVDPTQVILYSKKAANRNAWEILISAPNEKWLRWELERLCNSNLRNITLDEKGSVLDRYIVKRLLVVSTEGRQVADDWIRGQSRPGGDAIDWDFLEAESWIEGANADIDTVMLLDRQKIGRKSETLTKSMPKELQTWLCGTTSNDECFATKKSGESKCSTYAVVAPCVRHLRSALARFRSLDAIPESVSIQKLQNLGSYGKLVIVVRSGDRSRENEIINDFGSKLNTALSSVDMGFACTSKQDLKELIFASLDDNSSDKIDSANLAKIQKKIGKNCALVVADLTAVDCSTSYQAKSPVCLTQPYEAFNESKPSEPSEPRPNEKPLFGAHKYDEVNGSRANDPDYIRDHYKWKYEKMPKYYDDLNRWERKSRDYEERRRYHDMQWSRAVDAISSVRVTGNMRIYDASNLGTDTAGQLLFSCSLSGTSESRSSYKTDQVSLRGEDSRPDSLDAPEAISSIKDRTIISDAFERACMKSIEELKQKTVLPTDILDYVPHENIVEPITAQKTEQVSVEAIGATKLSAKPFGQALEGARDAAKINAFPAILKKIAQALPDAIVTEDDIKDKLEVIGEGWNAQASEYRVKFKFEGSVPVAD